MNKIIVYFEHRNVFSDVSKLTKMFPMSFIISVRKVWHFTSCHSWYQCHWRKQRMNHFDFICIDEQSYFLVMQRWFIVKQDTKKDFFKFWNIDSLHNNAMPRFLWWKINWCVTKPTPKWSTLAIFIRLGDKKHEV